MTAGSGAGTSGAAGGLARHIPVLVRPAIDYLNIRDGALIVDATFGAGGYTREILAIANCRVVAIDRDPGAVALGADLVAASGGRLALFEARFSELEDVLAGAPADGIVLDLGVSSMQLDTAERGFSFRFDGPLDMRMGNAGASAADVVAHASERDLADVIFTLGEERQSRSVARAIVAARRERAIRTTGELAAIAARVVRSKPGAIHPATRTFQALRMFVNDELGELGAALVAAERVLKPGGRLVVVSFHSLEDRTVKSFLAASAGTRAGSRHQPSATGHAATFRALTKKPVTADDNEVAANPRARSARLRAGERTEAPAVGAAIALPRLPSLDAIMRSGRR